MQRNNSTTFFGALAGLTVLALASLAHAQPATVAAVVQPVSKGPVAGAPIVVPAGAVLPQAISAGAPIANTDAGAGTLRRIEQLQREIAESDLRAKARGGTGSASPIAPIGMGAGTGPLPGFGQPGNGAQTVAPGVLPPFAGDQPQVVMPVAKVEQPSPAESAKAELVPYQTLAILLVNGKYKAEVSRDGVIRSIAIGSDIESWKVTKIDLDGVVVERKVTVTGKKKRKDEFTISSRLQNFKEGAATVVASTSSMAVPTPPPATGKTGMPDSTNVQVLRPVAPSSSQ